MSQLKPLVVGAAGNPARIQSGDTLDPAVLGSGIRDGTRFLRDDGTYAVLSSQSAAVIAFRARLSTNTTITADATRRKIILNSEDFDTTSAYDTSTGKFQPTTAGYYALNFSMYVAGSTGVTPYFTVALHKNGAAEATQYAYAYNVSNIGESVSAVVYLNGTTDYVETYYETNQPGTVVAQSATAYGSTLFSGCLVAAGLGHSLPAVFRAYRGDSAQVLAASATFYKAQLGHTIYNTQGEYDTSTHRFTPTVSGYYQISAAAYFTGTSITWVECEVRKNGSVVSTGPSGNTVAHTNAQCEVSDLVYLNGTTDYLELWVVFYGTSGNLAYGANATYFSGVRISDGAPVWGGIAGTLADQTDLQNALNAKQATLVSGTNVKTVNGQSIVGSGDLTVSGTGGGREPVAVYNDGIPEIVFLNDGDVVTVEV